MAPRKGKGRATTESRADALRRRFATAIQIASSVPPDGSPDSEYVLWGVRFFNALVSLIARPRERQF